MKRLILAIALLSGCGDDSACDPVANSGCDEGFTCEEVPGGDPASGCFAPLVVRGRVFDRTNDAAVAGARVVALDVNNAAVSSVAVTDAEGNYELQVPTDRMSDGTPVGGDLTLRADAAGFATFPSGLRVALPVDTGTAVNMDGT